MQMTPWDWSRLSLLSVLSGGLFFVSKAVLHDLPPLTVVLYPVSLAALALYISLYATDQCIP